MSLPSPPGTAVPHCEGCSRGLPDVDIMLSLRAGGMATYICADCILEMAEVAREARAEKVAAPAQEAAE
jgi:hypothetical protein